MLLHLQSVEPEILVELYDGESVVQDNGALSLVYQPLIDTGLVHIRGTVYDQQGYVLTREYIKCVL